MVRSCNTELAIPLVCRFSPLDGGVISGRQMASLSLSVGWSCFSRRRMALRSRCRIGRRGHRMAFQSAKAVSGWHFYQSPDDVPTSSSSHQTAVLPVRLVRPVTRWRANQSVQTPEGIPTSPSTSRPVARQISFQQVRPDARSISVSCLV